MKKIVTIVSLVLMILLSTTVCFAAISLDEVTDITPKYVGTQLHSENFSINSDGLATMNVSLKPLSTTTIDEVKVTLVIKNSLGTNVYNKTYDMEWSSLYGSFKTIKEYRLSANGVYEFQATYKCYKNNSLLETIKSSTILKSY